MKAAVSSALDRLQEASLKAEGPPSKWLDAHKDQVVLLLQEKSVSLTAELLGLRASTLFSWLQTRGIKNPRSPGVHPPEMLSIFKGKEGQRRSLDYWQGRAEALEELVKLLLQK